MQRALGGRWLVLALPAATVVMVACSSGSGTSGTAGSASHGKLDAATGSGAAGGRDSGGSTEGPHDGGADVADAGSNTADDAGPNTAGDAGPNTAGDAGPNTAVDAGSCVAMAERCNGLDDDCDGEVDEDLPALKCGRGACRVTVAACDDGVSVECVPAAPNSDGETCEGTDDDCDGELDEGCACRNGTHQDCYSGGPATRDVGECHGGAQTCVDGAWGSCDGDATPTVDVCDDLDNDCDPATPDGTDEAWFGDDCDSSMDTDLCATGSYGCASGGQTCSDDVASTPDLCDDDTSDDCNAATPDGTDEAWFGDDCDSPIDTDLCATGSYGCSTGIQTCSDDDSSTTEVCGNGIDEDCDGSDVPCCVAPTNTTCANAVSIVLGSMAIGDNTCSGADLLPAVSADCAAGDGVGNEVTYALAADGTPTSYTIAMTGDPGYDTLLHVHASSACDATDQLACADDVPAVSTSQVTVSGLPSGGTYYIVADGAGAGGDGFTLVSTSSAINHDTCTSPAPIAGNGMFTGTTTGRANHYTAPPGCSAATPTASADVVYRLVARSSATITASTTGSAFDTLLYVSTTCGSGAIACSDDFSGVQSQVSWSATAGTTYYLVIDGFDAAALGNYVLTISGY